MVKTKSTLHRRHLLNTFLLLLVLSTSTSQIAFQRTYGTSDSESGQGLRISRDKGFIFVGQKMYPGTSLNTFYGYILKTDSLGNFQWSKTYTTPISGFFSSVVPTTNNGYMVLGYSQLTTNIADRMLLLNIDSLGNILWTKTYGPPSSSTASSYIIQTKDGDFVLLGTTSYNGSGGIYDNYLVRIDPQGNVRWSKKYSGLDVCNKIIETADGGLFMAASTSRLGALNNDIYAIKLDASGNPLWCKMYGQNSADAGWNFIQTWDGGFLILGETFNYGVNTGKIHLIKTNANGDTTWTCTYNEPGITELRPYDLVQAPDSGFVITGFVQPTPGYYKGYLLKTNQNGVIIWAKTFSNSQFLYEVHSTIDKGFIAVANASGSFGAGNNDVLLIKLDSLGNSGCYQNPSFPVQGNSQPLISSPSISIDSGNVAGTLIISQSTDLTIKNTLCATSLMKNGTNSEEVIILPNPTYGSFSVGLETLEVFLLSVIDVRGNKLYKREIKKGEEVDLSEFSPGIYTLVLQIGKETHYRKLVISK